MRSFLEAVWSFANKEGGMSRLPYVYIRFGDIPQKDGKQIASTNHFTGKKEKGVSAYAAYYDRITKKFILQSGSEQLLVTVRQNI